MVATIKEEKYEAIFEKRQETPITFNELADQYSETSRFHKSFDSFKEIIIPVLLQDSINVLNNLAGGKQGERILFGLDKRTKP